MSWDRFEPFGLTHLLVVVLLGAATVAIIAPSRALGPERRDRRRVRLGSAAIAVQLAHQVYWIGLRGDSGESLPLHLCDVAGAVAVAAFLWPVRPMRALLYYWGLGLSPLAFIIPVLEEGPSTAAFWLFWLSHWVIVGGALYLVFVDRFRPRWRDLVFASLVMVGYGLVTVGLNIMWGSNYMYTGDHPMPTPGDFELRWPIPRVPVFGLAAVVLMTLAHLPWLLVRERPS